MHWRHIEVRNPLRPRTPTFFETLLAKEAQEKRAAELEKKRAEKAQRKAARNSGRASSVWHNLWIVLGWGKRTEGKKAQGEAEKDEETEKRSGEARCPRDATGWEVEWKGDWTAVLEDSEAE